MTHNFLLEIGLEEMPAQVVEPSARQLKEKTAAFLQEQLISFASIECFSTPRRLAIRVNGIAEQQADKQAEVKGPAKKIALTETGEWSKAALGFVKGQGLTPEDIYFKTIKEVEYVHVNKFTKGKPVAEILPLLVEVIASLHFPVSMHWANFDFKFIRPIHWLVALLDENVIPFELVGVSTDRISQGHRFLGQAVSLESATSYESQLAEQFVMVNSQARQAKIVEQIEAIATTHAWSIELDVDLLAEVTNLVEYPTAFAGAFDEKYLAIPEEVLVTSMKEHQRYFEVRDAQGSLLPFFISVRNGNQQQLDNVRKGNQKVLTARLEDAEFFYQEDQNLSIDDCLAKLKTVTFHEKIGTMAEKMQRVTAMAELLADRLAVTSQEKQAIQRASKIYKFDLVTNMVDEFPELQGIMGEKYALMQGESPAVATAIREHYLPIASEGELPTTTVGAVLAVADKLDTILSFFSVGIIPTGSNDPYALRRQAYGIIRIVADRKWHLSLTDVLKEIVQVINHAPSTYGIRLVEDDQPVNDFLVGRIKQFLAAKDIRKDIIDAVVASSQSDMLYQLEAANVLMTASQADSFRPTIEALARVMNLVKGQTDLSSDVVVDPSLFENESETALYQQVNDLLQQEITDLSVLYEQLIALVPTIQRYFEETMVMTENQAVRNNRLQQLLQLATIVKRLAAIDVLTIK